MSEKRFSIHKASVKGKGLFKEFCEKMAQNLKGIWLMSVKAMSIEDLYVYAKIDGLEHFLIYVEIDGVNVPMRLCEWDMDNECVILHESFKDGEELH